MFKYLWFIPFLFLLYSCSTIPLDSESPINETDTEIVIQKNAVYQGLNEFTELMESFDNNRILTERDIDHRDWLMEQINFWADKDQLAVQRIYEDLIYRNWSDEEKREYLYSVLTQLSEERMILLEDLAYLIDQSLLFREMPWMVRDFYDEQSEFSYWYLIYMGRSLYPFWLDDTVLPVMLELIPQDRITAVTYLWMKNPENLLKMKNEIYKAGYPWSRLIYLIEMSETVNSIIEEVMTEDEVKNKTNSGVLI